MPSGKVKVAGNQINGLTISSLNAGKSFCPSVLEVWTKYYADCWLYFRFVISVTMFLIFSVTMLLIYSSDFETFDLHCLGFVFP
jgi:hypothetical protein